MTEQTEPEGQEPEAKTKKWIGGEVPVELYDELSKIAKADMVPMTVVYRWALADFVAGRKGS